MSAPVGPAENAIMVAFQVRDDFQASKEFEALELVEIDIVAGFRRAMRHGSPMLRRSLTDVVLAQGQRLVAA